LVASFLGGQAIDRIDRSDGASPLAFWSFTSLAIALFVVLAALTFAILPYRMRFSISARDMIGIIEGR
jgi:hypothetical protein